MAGQCHMGRCASRFRPDGGATMRIRNAFGTALLFFFALTFYNTPSLADTTVGGRISADTTWSLANSPYVVTSTVQVYGTATSPVTLTIEPGVVVKFNSGTSLQIGNGTSQGALAAQGTAANHITFTRSGTSGTWNGLNFQDGTIDSTTDLEYVDVQYSTGVTMTSASPTIRNSTITSLSGYVSLSSSNPTLDTVTIANTGSYGIYLSSSSPIITGGSLTNSSPTGHGIYGSGSPVISNYNVSIVNTANYYGVYMSSATSALSITNSAIANGLYIGSTGIMPIITGNTFTNVDTSPIHAGANIIAQILSSNTINGMTSAGQIQIVGEQVKQDAHWTVWPAPYVVVSGTVQVYKDTTGPATLTIDPGVTVKFASSSGLTIGNGASQGALVAQGTAANHITFTRSGTSGTWSGLIFNDGTIDGTTDLEYVDIQYSTGVSMTSASPTIRNSTITNVTGYGLSLSSSNPVLDTVTITNTGTYGIYLSSSSSPVITNGSLTNSSTTGHGIYGSGSPVISNYSVSIVNTAGKYGVYLSGGSTSALSITNSTIANGLFIGSTGITPTITGNTFTNVDNSHMHAGANIIAQLLSGNTMNGMSSAGQIEVVGEQVAQDAHWTVWPAPYVVVSGTVSVYKDTTGPATLTIDPGVTVKFASSTGLQVANGTNQGALVAQGTAANHITFTRSGTSGAWSSLTFNDGTIDGTTVLQYVDIQYSSGITMNSASPTIRNSAITNVTGYGLNLNSSNPTLDTDTITNTGTYGIYLLNSSSPTITNGSLTNSSATGHGIYGSGSPIISSYTVSIVNTAAYYGVYLSSSSSTLSVTNSIIANGIYIGTNGITPTITGNTFTNVDTSPIHAGANIIAQILTNNTINNMTSAGRIEVAGEQVRQDAEWKQWAAPYVVVSGTVSVYKDTTGPATLTIDPGVTVKFASSSGLTIGNGASQGALVAQGTAANHITFTRSGTSGNWYGLNFQAGTIAGTTDLEYVDVQYSTGVTMTSASPTIRNSTITNVTGYGLTLNSSNPVLDTVTISNTGIYGINLNSSSPIITNGSLTNSSPTGHGIYGSGSPVISNYNVSIVNTANYYGVYMSSATSAMSITNSTIGNGIYIGSTGITPTITGNTFTNVDTSPIHAGANIIAQILSSNTINGMTSAGQIQIVGEQVKQDAHWTVWPAPYVVSGTVQVYKDTTGPATLTIDPGVTVKFASSSGLQVGNGASQGALVAQGTAANHIMFTRSGTSGTWSGLIFNDGTIDGTTDLEYVDIQYSTGVSMTSASPTIRNSTITNVTGYGLNLSSSNPVLDTVTITNNGAYGIYLSSSSPTITNGSLTNSSATGYGIYGNGSPVISNYNVSIVNTAAYYGLYLSSTSSVLSVTNSAIANGLYIGSTGITPTITGNTFTNADNSPIHSGANIIGQILNNNTVNNMTSAGRIEVVGETINQNTHWQKWTAPYVVLGTIYVYKDTTTTATLTIDSGAVIKFNTGTSMQIGSGSSMGALIAKGAAGNSILFTSSQTTPAPGNWYGVTLSGGASSASDIEYTTIEYAGSGANYNNADLTISSSAPILRNCLIRNSAGSGVYVTGSTNYPVIMDSELTGNKWGVYSTGSNPYITNTKIYSNTTAGAWNASTSPDVDARDNWWGVASGPTYTVGNAGGRGDAINDHVLYNPWLGQVPGTVLSITEARAMPISLNPNGGYVTFTASISSSATWTITITDANNNAVNAFTGTGTAIKQKWYGTNSQAVKVADGAYFYQINAVDPTNGNTASSPQGMIMVSSVVPIVYMDPPVDDQMFQGGASISVTGTASDPNGLKTYTLDYGVGGDPASWTTLKTSTTPVTDGLIYAWDTTSLTSGMYTLRLTVTDNAGNVVVDTARVRLLWTQNAAASEGYISPNGDNIKDTTTISAAFTYLSAWTITINDSSAATVRTYTGTGTSMAQSWDGNDSTGTVVPDGTYTYRIDATSTETSVQAASTTRSIIVDTTPPTAVISSPAANAVLRDIVQVLGTASDTNLDNYRLEYGLAAGAGPWTLISGATTPVSGGTLATWVTNDQTNAVLVQNGGYALRLTATDKAGNSSISIVPVSTDNLILSNIGASSHTLNTNNSESSAISFTINEPATVTLSIIPEKQGPTGTPVYQASQAYAAGAYSFTWNGTDNTGKVVPDEAYLYVLGASDGVKSDSYSPPAPTGTGSVTCSQSSGADPLTNQPMTITYTPTQPSRVTVSISWAAQNFNVLTAVPATPGSYSYVWDVRNPSGQPLDYGAGASCSIASLLRENYIITNGDTPVISALKTDPYAMSLSYGQFTRIEYTLSRDSNVTIQLVSPSGSAITVAGTQLQTAGPQELDWNDLDPADTNGMKALFSGEGNYMVTVTAVNPVTGSTSIARGNLMIGN